MALDEQKVGEAAGKVFGELGVAITGPLIALGDRLGLWAAMAGAGSVTPADLAARTGTVERYVREWLRGVAVAGYVGYDPAEGTFTLSEEMALVIAGEDSPASLIGVFEGFTALWADLATIEGFFRADAGVSDWANFEVANATSFPAADPGRGYDLAISTLVCTPASLAQPGAAALGAMAGDARLRQVLAEAGYPRVRRVAQEAAPFNIVLEARS
jgi:hypothetical protein